jgi:hypothetical protein
MAPMVWSDGLDIPNIRPAYAVGGTVRTGSDSVREIFGDAALDVGAGLLFFPASG